MRKLDLKFLEKVERMLKIMDFWRKMEQLTFKRWKIMRKYWKMWKIFLKRLTKFTIFIWKVKIQMMRKSRKCGWKWKLMKEVTATINTDMTIIRKIMSQIIFCG